MTIPTNRDAMYLPTVDRDEGRNNWILTTSPHRKTVKKGLKRIVEQSQREIFYQNSVMSMKKRSIH